MDRRTALLKRLEASWAEFTCSYAGLSPAELAEPGVTKAWSVRDIIAHVTTWEEEALRCLAVILDGRRPPRYSTQYGGIDAFNAMMSAQKRDLPLEEILSQQDEVHRRIVDLIERAPEEHLAGESRFRRRLRLDTYGHYAIHANAIRHWRAARPRGGSRGR